jgi:protein phosphatase
MTWLLEARNSSIIPAASAGTIGIHLVWEAFLLLCSLFLITLYVVIGAAAFFSCVLPLAVMVYAHQLWREARNGHVEAVRALTAAIDAADPMTRGLSERISKMSIQVARQLGLGNDEVQEIEYAALLHEVGRTAIQRDVRFKPGGLSQQEKAELRMHPRLGSEVVQRFGFFPGAPSVILSHHEQPDGRGYPQGLQGDEIPLGSRILMAVAAFDAMTSDRPYRRGLPPKTAFDELLGLAGHQFFPDVVEALIDLYASGELFSAFDTDILESFARGDGNSRALEEHLVRRGHRLARPTSPETFSPADDDEVPVLELPSPEEGNQATPKSAQERTHVVHEQFAMGNATALRLDVAAMSDVGCVRENNEDSFGLFRELPRHDGSGAIGPDAGCLIVVADGMGGAAGGEVASNLAVDMVRDTYFGNDVHDSCRDSLHESLRLANELIHWRAASESELEGMGTTCTAAALVGDELHVAHVGDSRAYLVRSGSVESLTRDHTLAAELKAATGQEGPPGAHSVLTRCLGSRTEVEVELSRAVKLQAGDVLVLCSDGLWNQVDAQEIREIVLSQSPEVACSKLVDRARQRGGPDNITVVVARVEPARVMRDSAQER